MNLTLTCGRPLPQELRLGDDEVAALPAVDQPGPIKTLQMTFQSAARSHAALARLRTLCMLKLWRGGKEGPPRNADTAALLEALAALPGVRVELRRWQWEAARRFRLSSSNPKQLRKLRRAFADALKNWRA